MTENAQNQSQEPNVDIGMDGLGILILLVVVLYLVTRDSEPAAEDRRD